MCVGAFEVECDLSTIHAINVVFAIYIYVCNYNDLYW